MLSILFPNIDPVIFNLGPVPIRFYSLAYIAGILLGVQYIKFLNKKNQVLTEKAIDDLIPYAVLGIIIGGRIGYVLFYGFIEYLQHPLEIFKTWKGGMSFHGGLIGVFIAFYLFARKYKIGILPVTDLLSVAAPIGIFFGRMANFINAELYGRVTDVPWGVVFPNAGVNPRHPSQIYEALLEGCVTFIILALLAKNPDNLRKEGYLSGVFLTSYGCFRIFCEFFRMPTANIEILINNVTMGQLLSIPMIFIGISLIMRSKNK